MIRKTVIKIKEAKNNRERQYYAEDILQEAIGLLSCPNCSTRNPVCLNCRSISHGYIKEYKHLAKDKVKENVINK
ncbi:hypothetical protein HQ584_08030 [Patescibacteria group bacterium]|nr:hypothetical protein [Patescibacteria group bacterium]